MRIRALLVAAGLAVTTASAALPAAAGGTASAVASTTVGRAAPYLYLGWGDPPEIGGYLAATGLEDVTLAFVLSGKKCVPAWDGYRPLHGGADEAAIAAVRAAGGDVVVSFGGYNGRKLGATCKKPAALAAAYQQVIDAYGLHAIDLDVENGEIRSRGIRRRIIDALVLLEDANPTLEIYVTIGTGRTGPDRNELDLMAYAAGRGFMPTAWVAMPFDFGTVIPDMASATITAGNGFATAIAAAYSISAATALEHTGISTMNGMTDDAGAVVSLADFGAIRDWADANGLARLSFWAANRDRQCATPTTASQAHCSGVVQAPWAFSQALATF